MNLALRFCSLFVLLSVFSLMAQDAPDQFGRIVPENHNTAQLLSPNSVAAVNYVLPDNGSTSGNSRAPQGSQRYERCIYLITAAEMQAAGVQSGTNFTSLGFVYSVAQNLATTGTFQVYFMNTADVANNASTTWATAITGMTKVDSSQGTIPAATVFDKTLSNPSAFTYTGGGIYVAWEYSNPSNPVATTGNTALCINNLVNGLKSNFSSTAMPTTIAASSFRPGTRLGYAMANDASVDLVYTLGKILTSISLPHQVSARIRNSGDNVLTNLVVTLNVTGANTFTNTQAIASLTPGQTIQVTFSGYSPSVLGVDTVAVSIPSDGNLINNVKKMIQTVTAGTYAYSDGSNSYNSAYGFGVTGSGGFLSKFYVKGTATLNSVRCFIYSSAANPSSGNTVKGIAYNTAGVKIAESADYVLLTTDSLSYITINFLTPPNITNDSVYVGLWQTPSIRTTAYYPMGTQSENPTRMGASYELYNGVISDDGGPGGTGRLMIEGNFTPVSAGTLLFSEDFTSLTPGNLDGQGGWVKFNTDVMVANTTPLTYPGYNYGGGQYATYPANSATNGRVYRDFSDSLSLTTPGAVVYYSMLLNMNTTYLAASNQYFFALGQAPGTTNYFAKLFAKQLTATTYNLGVSKSSNTASFVTTTMNTNQTYLVVVRYNCNNTALGQSGNTCYMWINPSGSGEPDTATADAKVWAGQGDFTTSNVSSVAFHNRGVSTPLYSADGIRVAGSLTSSSDAWTALNPGPLPVELISFSASVSGKSVNLSWKTASEINNKGFYVERKSGSENWLSLGFVSGNGSTLHENQYSYSDINSGSGKYSYRLRQVDFDGTFSFSNVVTVDLSIPTEFVLNQNYPNPFNPSTKISYQLPVDSKVKIELYNITGQKLADLVNSDQSAGSYSIEVNANTIKNIASGVYIYRLTAVSKVNGINFINTKKMMLMK